jgi:hypothetical protein
MARSKYIYVVLRPIYVDGGEVYDFEVHAAYTVKYECQNDCQISRDRYDDWRVVRFEDGRFGGGSYVSYSLKEFLDA